MSSAAEDDLIYLSCSPLISPNVIFYPSFSCHHHLLFISVLSAFSSLDLVSPFLSPSSLLPADSIRYVLSVFTAFVSTPVLVLT